MQPKNMGAEESGAYLPPRPYEDAQGAHGAETVHGSIDMKRWAAEAAEQEDLATVWRSLVAMAGVSLRLAAVMRELGTDIRRRGRGQVRKHRNL